LPCSGPLAGETWNALAAKVTTPYCLFVPQAAGLVLDQQALERLMAAAEATGAAMVYGDYGKGRGGRYRSTP
jgi:hypothetical protein